MKKTTAARWVGEKMHTGRGLKISGVWFKECENRLVKRNRRVEVEFFEEKYKRLLQVAAVKTLTISR